MYKIERFYIYVMEFRSAALFIRDNTISLARNQTPFYQEWERVYIEK